MFLFTYTFEVQFVRKPNTHYCVSEKVTTQIKIPQSIICSQGPLTEYLITHENDSHGPIIRTSLMDRITHSDRWIGHRLGKERTEK